MVIDIGHGGTTLPFGSRKSAMSLAGARQMVPPEPLEVTRQQAAARKAALSQSSVVLGGCGGCGGGGGGDGDVPEGFRAEHSPAGWGSTSACAPGNRAGTATHQAAAEQNRAQRALAASVRAGAHRATHDFYPAPAGARAAEEAAAVAASHARRVQPAPAPGVRYRPPAAAGHLTRLRLGADEDGPGGEVPVSVLHEAQQIAAMAASGAVPREARRRQRAAFLRNRARQATSKVWLGPTAADLGEGAATKLEPLTAPGTLDLLSAKPEPAPALGPYGPSAADKAGRLAALRASSVLFGDARVGGAPRRGQGPGGGGETELPSMEGAQAAHDQYTRACAAARRTQVFLGEDPAEYRRSNAMPNWHDPATYRRVAAAEEPAA